MYILWLQDFSWSSLPHLLLHMILPVPSSFLWLLLQLLQALQPEPVSVPALMLVLLQALSEVQG